MTEMPDVLKLHADGTPDHHAVIVDASHGARSSVSTFAELNELVNRLVHGLRAAGIEQGDRLVWCGPNSLEVIAVIHAARKAGLVAVPLSYRFNSDEMQYVIDNSDATLVIADAEYAPLIEAARDRLPKVRAYVGFVATEAPAELPDGWLAWPEVIADQPAEEPVAPDASSVGAQMLYTSGTTGKPKGALRTTTNREIVLALLAELGLQFGNEVHITTGPMYHSGPLAFVVDQPHAGCTDRRATPLRPGRVARGGEAALRDEHVLRTHPAQARRQPAAEELAHADLSSMRCLIANAAPVPYALKQEIIEKLGDGFLFEVYGSTELGIITVLRPKTSCASRDRAASPTAASSSGS